MSEQTCNDIQFARDLIKRMSEGGGRYNSTVSPLRVYATPAVDVVQPQIPIRNEARQSIDYAGMETARRMYLNSPQAVGRWSNGYIYRMAEFCSVGDAFPFKTGRDDGFRNGIMEFRNPFTRTPYIFEKRSVTVTADDGRTFHEEIFWERVK